MNYLMCSVGRRAELMKDFRLSCEPGSRLIGADNSPVAPALYFCDKQYLVPKISDPSYIEEILSICKREKINAVTTLIDPEIQILAEHRNEFENIGVEVLAPYSDTAALCFDKYQMFCFLKEKGIPTASTWGTFEETKEALNRGEARFPLFVKPRRGSGSVGAHKVESVESLELAFQSDPTLIAQEFMDGIDLDADIYIDTISHKPVSAFSKRKISTTIGGANKTISFKDEKLFDFIKKAIGCFKFNGPIDADFFYKDGQYYLSEINPRFGGAYLHAYGAGVDFIKLIENNLHGIENQPCFGDYDEGVVMMMYDSVVIKPSSELSGKGID